MSLFADYKKEREGKETIETDWGFAVYIINENKIYLEDIYIVPSERKLGRASHLADMVVAKGKEAGCTLFVGSVLPSANGSSDSMKAHLAYGLKLACVSGNLIMLTKEI